MFDSLFDEYFLMLTLQGGHLTVDLAGVQQCCGCNEEVETAGEVRAQSRDKLSTNLRITPSFVSGVRVVLDNN